MADKLNAIGTYRPRIKQGDTVQMDELARLIAARTNFNEGAVSHALKELRDVVAFYTLAGRAVKLEGLGTYSPTLSVQGKFGVSHRLDKRLNAQINAPDAFGGTIINKEMIGKTTAEFITMWNEENPDDPVAG